MKRTRLLTPLAALAPAVGLLLPPAAAAQSDAPPAGGSPLGEVIIATGAAGAVLAGLIAVGLARRAGRAGFIAPFERLASRSLGLPGWAALPVTIATGALIAAVFGLYWDISLHIDDGRDEGPLANPAHYFILGGLLGIFAAGWLAVVLPREQPGPAAVRIVPGWQAPVGGLVMIACSYFAALGFPLDDVWHRLFGQDVTLWGPTHLMMLTGAAMTLVGIFILIVEGRLASGRSAAGPSRASGALSLFASRRVQYVLAGGGLLAGLSIYQGEFDFGVPQFSLLYHPVLITLAGSVSLVTARLLAGPGGAIGAVGFFLALRGAITLLVGPVFGQSVPHFPTYIAAALLVEAIAWRIGTERPYRFAVAAGAAIGTAGVLAEWAWTHVWMPLAWPSHLLGEALALSLPVGVAGAVLGAFLACGLRLRPGTAGMRPALAATAGVVVVAMTLGFLLPTNVPDRASARVLLTEAQGPAERSVHATVRIRPPGLAEDADWLQGMAWQGQDRVVVAPLERITDDVYRTTEPLPVSGSWKSTIRLHRGRTMGALPVYAPQDAAIPAPRIPAPRAFERVFQPDRELLQRERRADVPGWAWTAASLTVLALGLALLALLGWALRRLAASAPAHDREHAPLAGLGAESAQTNGQEPDDADVHIAIIGSGFAGLAMAIRLKQAGATDFVVLERAAEVGGTWRDNTYPGCQCDVPSHLYSLSFALNPEWSRTYSMQPEIQDYLRDCADRFGVRPHIRFRCEVLGAAWDAERELWRLHASGGELTARFVIAAPGGLSEPSMPEIPGLDRFQGAMFHSARWDHDHDLTGERVAVIGTGASSIQFVPQIQPDVSELCVFQRTPPWIMPHTDRPVTRIERGLYRALPFTQRLVRAAIYWSRETFVLGFAKDRRLLRIGERIARRHLRRQVPDRELRRKLRPSYSLGCKRVLLSNDYYPALTRPNVDVITDRIREVRPTSILTEDGAEREVDTIILGTGFHVTDLPIAHAIRDRDGRTLAERWQGSPQAYLGTTIAGLPNAFMLIGPNTGLGHNSIVFMAEAQVSYVMDCLQVMADRGAEVFEVREEAQLEFNAEIQSQMDGTVWMSGGCQSWYIDETGRNTTLWPDFTWRFHRRTRTFDPDAYVLRRRAPANERVEVPA